MLENFHLAAIIEQDNRMRLLQIPLHQALQERLAGSWKTQYDRFVEEVQEIYFNPGYQPEGHECFCIENYTLPDWLEKEDSRTVPELDAISSDEALIDSIKGIVAFARDDRNEEVMLFQNFSHSHVIRPGRFLFIMHSNTYETTQGPGLTLGVKLSAVYLPSESKLLFRSFRTVNTFLPLADFYEEASEQEIREILSHELLAPENPDAMATGATQWFRKRFAMLRDSGVLDEYSAIQIEDRSNGYDVEIDISRDRIFFPADKLAAKKVLQFLNEEIFRGPITEKIYETNSKRQAD